MSANLVLQPHAVAALYSSLLLYIMLGEDVIDRHCEGYQPRDIAMPQPHKQEQTKAAKHAGSRGDKHHQVPQAETKDKAGEAAQLPTAKHSTSGAAQTAGGGASSTAGLTTYADFVSKVREKKMPTAAT